MGAAASGLRGGETELPHKKFVLPQAPVRPVTANGGQPMTSWMDLEALPVTMALKDPVSSTPHAPHRNNSSHTAYLKAQ